MPGKIDLKCEARPMVVTAEIRTKDEFDKFIRLLHQKWAEYSMPRTETWQGVEWK